MSTFYGKKISIAVIKHTIPAINDEFTLIEL